MQPCLVCGSEDKKPKSKYCSDACNKKAYKLRNREEYLQKERQRIRRQRHEKALDYKPVMKSCVICESRFEQSKYHPNQKCCNYKCNSKWYRQNHPEKVKEHKRKDRNRNWERIKKYHAQYKDQLRFSGNRLRALNRDEFTCQECGYVAPYESKDRSEDVVVHHIDFSGNSKKPNHRINNLQTLCRGCHIKLHTHVVSQC